MKKIKKSSWKAMTVIFALAFIIDLFIPDPLPFIDETILIAASIYSLYKIDGSR